MEGCGKPTVGPSDEGPDKFISIGVAAHICAASAGPGARRYDPNMTPAERSAIENGIWLCQDCSVLIDRDEEAYPASRLREIKARHEESRKLHPDKVAKADRNDLIAIGPDIVALGQITEAGETYVILRLRHFISGTMSDLIAFSHDFSLVKEYHRYVLMNELGYGRHLELSPTVRKVESECEVQFEIPPRLERTRFQDIGATMCRDTGRLLTGNAAFRQNLESLLGLAIGSWIFSPLSGSRISEYYHDYKGSTWLDGFIKLEIIRLSSIKNPDNLSKSEKTPLLCVNSVNSVEVLGCELNDQRLSVSIVLDLEGLGLWRDRIEIFIYSEQQLRVANNRTIPPELRGIVDC